ncbi:MAG: glycosyltransferase [Rhodothermales bacterium]|nr:glycosyltransferase [Rhodothermales bacterium]
MSVVVAARDEAEGIAACIVALRAQDYPNLEVVVVDDHSSDETATTAEGAAEGDARFVLTRNDADPGKKYALMRGIEASSGDILAFTDADCRPGPRWVSGLVALFRDDTVFVAGYSPFHPRIGLFQGVLALETASTAVIASGLIGLGLPTMCAARNMAYRRTAYEESGGLAPIAHIASGDDTLMLQRLSKLGNVAYATSPDAHVPTAPPATFRHWFRQKTRHLSTVGRYAPSQLLAAIVIRSMDLLVLVGVPAFLLGLVGPAILWALLVKVAADFLGLLVGLKPLRERGLLRFLPALEAVYSPLLLLFVLAGFTRRVQWK